MNLHRLRHAPLVLAALLGGCAHGGGVGGGSSQAPSPPAADSATVALWRFDESIGPRMFDSGPSRLEGSAGIDTRGEFGRFGRARSFQRLSESFVLVPYEPALDPGGPMTIEAWVRPDEYTDYEMSVIVARWSPVPNEQSWVLGLAGTQRIPDDATAASPGTFRSFVTTAGPGQIVFAFQPTAAAAPQVCVSSASLPIGSWTHVAVTLDGELVQLYLDGVLDSQCIQHGFTRPSSAPLVVGNLVDERRLSGFGGDLRPDPGTQLDTWYSFVGGVDEVRLSDTARTRFESSLLR